jgi:hypothetical protein
MSAPRCGGIPAEPRRAGDGFQRPLRFRFQPRLTPSVSWLFHNPNFPLLSESNLRDKISSNEGRYR